MASSLRFLVGRNATCLIAACEGESRLAGCHPFRAVITIAHSRDLLQSQLRCASSGSASVPWSRSAVFFAYNRLTAIFLRFAGEMVRPGFRCWAENSLLSTQPCILRVMSCSSFLIPPIAIAPALIPAGDIPLIAGPRTSEVKPSGLKFENRGSAGVFQPALKISHLFASYCR